MFARLRRLLDYAYRFLMLVLMLPIVYALAAVFLVGMSVWIASIIFRYDIQFALEFALYSAVVAGFRGLIVGWKSWRAHLHSEALHQFTEPKK